VGTTVPADTPMVKDRDNTTVEPTGTGSKEAPAATAPAESTEKGSKKAPAATAPTESTEKGSKKAPAVAAPAKDSSKATSKGNTKKSTTAIININSESLKDLQQVKGIGPVTAKKIVDGRPYKSLDDLVTKKVLTQKQLDNFKTQMTVK
jgi:competence protein ComEA